MNIKQLLNKIKKSIEKKEILNDWKIAAIIFLIVTLIFSFPIFTVINNLGIHDWDQHLFYEGVPRATILEYQQFPLWNPWQCGGNVMLANPQSSFLSIHFPLTLLFGEVVSTKLAIPLYLFIGLFGMWLVCRKLGMDVFSSYIPPVIVMLSGVYAIRVTVGHTNWFYLAWIPWTFFFFLKARDCIKYIIPCGFFLALIFLGGGVHPFIITIIFLGTYTFFVMIKEMINIWKLNLWKQETSKRILLRISFLFFITLIIWMPFAAIKLLPLLAVYNEMLPIEHTDVQPNNLALLYEAMTKKIENFEDINDKTQYTTNAEMEEIQWHWNEYYGYIGIVPLILFFIACIVCVLLFASYWEYLISALFVFFLILSQNILPYLWKLLGKLPLMSIFHGPSRFLFAAILFMAISIGFLCTHLEKKQSKFWQWLIVFLFFILVFDLTTANSPLFVKGLALRSIDIDYNIKDFEQSFYTIFADNNENFYKQYPLFLENKGFWNCYERFQVFPAVIPKISTSGIEYGDYHGEAYIYQTNEQQTITFFSPNKIIVSIDSKIDSNEINNTEINNNNNNGNNNDNNNKEEILILNQNYISGWKAKIDGKKAEVLNTNGLVSAKISGENKIAEFYYLPNAFLLGAVISVLAVIGCICFFRTLKTNDKIKKRLNENIYN